MSIQEKILSIFKDRAKLDPLRISVADMCKRLKLEYSVTDARIAMDNMVYLSVLKSAVEGKTRKYSLPLPEPILQEQKVFKPYKMPQDLLDARERARLARDSIKSLG